MHHVLARSAARALKGDASEPHRSMDMGSPAAHSLDGGRTHARRRRTPVGAASGTLTA